MKRLTWVALAILFTGPASANDTLQELAAQIEKGIHDLSVDMLQSSCMAFSLSPVSLERPAVLQRCEEAFGLEPDGSSRYRPAVILNVSTGLPDPEDCCQSIIPSMVKAAGEFCKTLEASWDDLCAEVARLDDVCATPGESYSSFR